MSRFCGVDAACYCTDGVDVAAARRALERAPEAERRAMAALLADPFHQGLALTPINLNMVSGGGNDCRFNTDRGRADADKIRAFVRRYGGVGGALGGGALGDAATTVTTAAQTPMAGVPVWVWVAGALALWILLTRPDLGGWSV